MKAGFLGKLESARWAVRPGSTASAVKMDHSKHELGREVHDARPALAVRAEGAKPGILWHQARCAGDAWFETKDYGERLVAVRVVRN